jgi:protein-tyrosine phosphatase
MSENANGQREIIVVCYGNICRSPIGEILLQRALDDAVGPGRFLVTSAGIGADDGRPPSQGTIRAMAERGIDARSLRSTFLRPADAHRAWRIYCMESYQVDHVRGMLRDGHERVQLMAGEEVDDPLGSTQDAYEEVARQLERLLPVVVADITAAIAQEA